MARFLCVLAVVSLGGCAGGYGAAALTPVSSPSFARPAPASNCPKASGGSGILADGDFSQAAQPATYMGFTKGQSFAPSWHVAKNTIDFVGSTYWNMAGLCSVDIDGGNAGTIAHKAFATTVGAKYTATFLLSGNGSGAPAVKTLKVSAANASKTFTWDTSNGNDVFHGKYAKKSWTFTAVKTMTTLKFASLDGASAYGAVIAAIAVKKN